MRPSERKTEWASLELGGVGSTVTTVGFVRASVEWLKEYCLVNNYFAGGVYEAVWKKRCGQPML